MDPVGGSQHTHRVCPFHPKPWRCEGDRVLTRQMNCNCRFFAIFTPIVVFCTQSLNKAPGWPLGTCRNTGAHRLPPSKHLQGHSARPFCGPRWGGAGCTPRFPVGEPETCWWRLELEFFPHHPAQVLGAAKRIGWATWVHYGGISGGHRLRLSAQSCQALG